MTWGSFAEIQLQDPIRPGLGGSSQAQCLSFRDMFPFLVKEARENISKDEYAKALSMEIYALLLTANGNLAKCMLEEVKT